MRNVTIAMDEDLHQKVQVDAANAGLSVSQYIADVLKAADGMAPKSEIAPKQAQLEALERILSGPMWDVSENGRMPNADERNARR